MTDDDFQDTAAGEPVPAPAAAPARAEEPAHGGSWLRMDDGRLQLQQQTQQPAGRHAASDNQTAKE